MKKCPHCGEKIQDSAKKCKICGEWLNFKENHKKEKIINQKKVISNNFLIATMGTRFLNRFLDFIFFVIFLIIIFLIFGIDDSNSTLVSYILLFLYYCLFEFIRGKTPAKFITKTKVINEYGEKPDFWNICGRTLCRFIPFEAFSFLANSHPRGWHDSISKTYVVEDK